MLRWSNAHCTICLYTHCNFTSHQPPFVQLCFLLRCCDSWWIGKRYGMGYFVTLWERACQCACRIFYVPLTLCYWRSCWQDVTKQICSSENQSAAFLTANSFTKQKRSGTTAACYLIVSEDIYDFRVCCRNYITQSGQQKKIHYRGLHRVKPGSGVIISDPSFCLAYFNFSLASTLLLLWITVARARRSSFQCNT